MYEMKMIQCNNSINGVNFKMYIVEVEKIMMMEIWNKSDYRG